MKNLLVGTIINEGKGTCDFCQEKDKEGLLGEISKYYSCSNYECYSGESINLKPLICKDCIKQLYEYYLKK